MAWERGNVSLVESDDQSALTTERVKGADDVTGQGQLRVLLALGRAGS